MSIFESAAHPPGSPDATSAPPHANDSTPQTLLDECPEGGFFELAQWLPALEQMQDALRLKVEDAVNGRPAARPALGPCPATSMRHGTGLVFAMALIAGLLPFIISWIQAIQLGTVAPFVNWVRPLQAQGPFPTSDALAPLFTSTARSIFELQPWLPAWLAAGLSALGQWLSWPLQWLTTWIVYGVGVLGVSHLLGARATLQPILCRHKLRLPALPPPGSCAHSLVGRPGRISCLCLGRDPLRAGSNCRDRL
jgi:hypothetical protein